VNTGVHALRVAAAWRAAGGSVETASIPAGESAKTLGQAAELYSALARLPADRGTVILAVGGGVVGDLAGFVAATYARGLPWVVVPTSLLAMVDSAVGGKVGINLPEGKNLVGAFHQPLAVWVSLDTLQTLPDREYRSGLAEVVKYGIIADADFFAWLESHAPALVAREPEALRHAIRRSLEIKAAIVAVDEREESGQRVKLNFGHTFGHAFETLAQFSLLHGEAVAMGMMCAARLASRLGLCPSELVERLSSLLTTLGLPTAPPQTWSADQILAAMATDKKRRADRLRFVLPRLLGQVEIFEPTYLATVKHLFL
jgi:3-dehydroquinate synthase